jgi:hypothetical protein
VSSGPRWDNPRAPLTHEGRGDTTAAKGPSNGPTAILAKRRNVALTTGAEFVRVLPTALRNYRVFAGAPANQTITTDVMPDMTLPPAHVP